MIDPRYPGLSRAIVTSLLWRAGAATVDAFARAWPGSRSAKCVGAAAPLRGVSSVALLAAAAGTIAVAMQFAVPAYVRPGLPMMWPIAVILLLTIVAARAHSFEQAWPHSRVARLLAIRRPQR